MHRGFCVLALFLLVLTVALGTSACGAAAKPTVVISSPPHGSQFHDGETVAVQSIATDMGGIARVELVVNGATVRTDSPPSPQGQTSFVLIQTWKATQGTHTVSVRAYNTANVVSDPAVITITVAAPLPTPTAPVYPTPPPPPATPAPTATIPPPPLPPTPTTVPLPPSSGCTNNAAFVADVTVPDGTLLAPAQPFNKIWRLKNAGTCAWEAGYTFVFVGGEAMATTTTVAVPATAPGATADLLVALTAPTVLGAHTGQWRLRNPSNVFFGPAVNVTVKVVDASAPPVPVTTAPPAASSSCSGSPAIASFTTSAASIIAGGSATLSWGAVSNADSVDITPGIGGVGAPGSATVSPAATTAYTLTAHCGANTATRQATVAVTKLLIVATVSNPVLVNPGLLIVFQVSNVSVKLAQKVCTAPIFLAVPAGDITTTREGDVTYQWEGSGITPSPTTIHYDGAETKTVVGPAHTGTGTLYTARLHVTKPNDKSAAMNYTCP